MQAIQPSGDFQNTSSKTLNSRALSVSGVQVFLPLIGVILVLGSVISFSFVLESEGHLQAGFDPATPWNQGVSTCPITAHR